MPKLDIFSNPNEIWVMVMPHLDVFSNTSDIAVKAIALQNVGRNSQLCTYLMMFWNAVLARAAVGCVAMMYQEVEDIRKQQCCCGCVAMMYQEVERCRKATVLLRMRVMMKNVYGGRRRGFKYPSRPSITSLGDVEHGFRGSTFKS